MSKRFVLNDDTVKNSYGFRVLTKGIKLDAFLKNPVCLNDHKNDTHHVLGRWEDLKAEGAMLTGLPVFDTQDEQGKEVVRKVEKGIIKGCSMGIRFRDVDLEEKDGYIMLKTCELFEASIVPVPANSHAIALYNMQGKPLSDTEIKQFELTVKKGGNYKNLNTMKKLNTYLQLSEDADEMAAITAVKEIELRLRTAAVDRDHYKKRVSQLEESEKARLKADFEAAVDAAVKDGRLDTKGKAAIVEMTDGKYDKAKALLNALPKHKSVAASLETDKTALAQYEKKSWKELDQGNHLARLKAEHKEYYAERFKREFGGKEPENV